MKAFKHLFFGEAIYGAVLNRVKLNSVCSSNNSQGLFDCCPAGISPIRRNFEEAL